MKKSCYKVSLTNNFIADLSIKFIYLSKKEISKKIKIVLLKSYEMFL